MSGSGSATLETQVLQHTLGVVAMPFPGALFFALCTTPPTSTTPGTPVAGGGYVRMPATFAIVPGNTSEAANAATIEWPAATAPWGNVGWLEIWDDALAGNRKFWGPLVDPVDLVTPIQRQIQTGDVLRVPSGGVVIACS